MSDKISTGSSLIFYTGKNYAGTAKSVSHGITGVLAANTTSWNEQSVAMSAMQVFISSSVNTGDTSVVYLGHQEEMVTVSQSDLTLLYPSSDQFPLNYLGLDPVQAVVVWLEVDAAQAAPNAVASNALVGASPTTITTLSLPGRPGLLGCVAKIGGSSVIANCAYGDYNTADGTVAWEGTGTLILEYTGGSITLINDGGFPEGWTFSDPQLQGDGSWAVTLNGGSASDTISTVAANPGSITDDGISASVITARVVDGHGQPAGGVTVSWSSSLGSVSPQSSETGADGTATTTLTDVDAPGMATVTVAITGSSETVDVTVADSAANAPMKVYFIDNTSPPDGRNRISAYCNELLSVKVTVDGQAEFVGGDGTKTYATTLSPYGPNIINLVDSVVELVNVTVTPDDTTASPVSASMAFVQPLDVGYHNKISFNQNIPADGITYCSLKVYGTNGGTLSIGIKLGGSAHFAETLEKEWYIADYTGGYCTAQVKIVDLVAETVPVTVTINDDNKTVIDINFDSLDPKYM
ncbi:UNVERIFIED_ORG: hypothetical protein J2Y78_004918 [Buttiauxella agrestis ATCC 33320]